MRFRRKGVPSRGKATPASHGILVVSKILAQPLQSSPATRRVYRKAGAPPEGLNLPGLLPPLPRPVFLAVDRRDLDELHRIIIYKNTGV